MVAFYETLKQQNRATLKSNGLALMSLGGLLLIASRIVELGEFSSGLFAGLSIVLNVLAIIFLTVASVKEKE